MSPIWQATNGQVKSSCSTKVSRGAMIRAVKSNYSTKVSHGARIGSTKSGLLIEVGTVGMCRVDGFRGVNRR